jgi:desulfoferrodoxin (superoxide reductase-like protein)
MEEKKMSDEKDITKMSADELETYFISLKKTEAGVKEKLDALTEYMTEEYRAGRYIPVNVKVGKDVEHKPVIENENIKNHFSAWVKAHAEDKAVYGKFVTKDKVLAMDEFKGKDDAELIQMDVLYEDISKKVSFMVRKN